MGGTLRVVIRQKNGKITKMTRSTNNLSLYFQTYEFAKTSNEVLSTYIKDRNEDDEGKEVQTFSPTDYGLLVIDDINKVILSHQNYTALDKYRISSLSNDIHMQDQSGELNWNKPDHEVPFFNQIDVLHEDFYIKRHYDLFMNNMLSESKEFSELLKSKQMAASENLEKILSILNKAKKTKDDWKEFLIFSQKAYLSTFFDVSLGEYKYISFNKIKIDEKLQYVKFKEKLDELGFKLTKKDLNDWTKFFTEREE